MMYLGVSWAISAVLQLPRFKWSIIATRSVNTLDLLDASEVGGQVVGGGPQVILASHGIDTQ